MQRKLAAPAQEGRHIGAQPQPHSKGAAQTVSHLDQCYRPGKRLRRKQCGDLQRAYSAGHLLLQLFCSLALHHAMALPIRSGACLAQYRRDAL